MSSKQAVTNWKCQAAQMMAPGQFLVVLCPYDRKHCQCQEQKSHLGAEGQGGRLLWPLRGISGISWKGGVSHWVWLPGLPQDTAMPTSPALSLQLSLTELTPGVHPARIIPSSCHCKEQALIKSKGSSRRCSKTMQCAPCEGHWRFTTYSHFSTFRAFFVLG